MQQIYMQSDEQLEVFTTVFSPQVCRSRTRTRHLEAEQVVVVVNYRARWPEELDLSHGDLIQVLSQEDPSWWFGRLADGNQGYFPAACVAASAVGGKSAKTPPSLGRRGSVPVAMATADVPCGPTGGHGTPKLPRKNSIRWALGADARLAPPPGSPSLLHRVLAKSRRKSCPHLPHLPPDTGSFNAAFQPD